MRLAWICLSLSIAYPQVATEANKNFRTPEGRKTFAERSVASMDGRANQEDAKAVITAASLQPGMTVVDLGTGPGRMLPFLSAAVGPKGKVIAMDIFEDLLATAKTTAADRHLSNVSFVLGTDKDPRLPPGSADVVFAIDSYHHFDYPEQTVAGIRDGLKPVGRLVVVDFYKSKHPNPPHVRLERDDLIQEVEGFGFNLLSKQDYGPRNQYIAIFRKK